MQELPRYSSFFDAEEVRRMHHRGVDHHVVVDELRRPRRVGQDAADGAGDEKDVLGTVGAEPVVHRRLIAQIELVARRGQDVLVAERERRRSTAEPTRPRWPATNIRESSCISAPILAR